MAGAVAKVVARAETFIKKTNSHNARIRSTTSYAANAVSVLSQIMTDQKESAANRIKAATAIMEYQVAMVKDDNQDEIARLRSELEYQQELKSLVTIDNEGDEEDDSYPDFSKQIAIA